MLLLHPAFTTLVVRGLFFVLSPTLTLSSPQTKKKKITIQIKVVVCLNPFFSTVQVAQLLGTLNFCQQRVRCEEDLFCLSLFLSYHSSHLFCCCGLQGQQEQSWVSVDGEFHLHRNNSLGHL